MPHCIIGESCKISQNVVISPEVVLGNNVKVQNNVSIYTGVICEDDVFGLGVFKNSLFLTFQNNVNVPTPENYAWALETRFYLLTKDYYQRKLKKKDSAFITQ